MVLTAWAMPHEDPYRITLLAILCVTLVMMGYHRWQASRSGERISHKEEGYVFAVALLPRGIGNACRRRSPSRQPHVHGMVPIAHPDGLTLAGSGSWRHLHRLYVLDVGQPGKEPY